MEKIAYLSLGSNIGDRARNLRAAIDYLSQAGAVTAVSSFFETEPVEFARQAWFLNCAVALRTKKLPRQLLASVLKIEESMGRKRTQRKGPRIIDIDVLLFSNAIVNLPELTIPHPSMHLRRFVLEPLAEIAPGAIHPVLKRSVADLRGNLPPAAGRVRPWKP